jgi:tRNAThr (cytosine32-N3)-methyltransferase
MSKPSSLAEFGNRQLTEDSDIFEHNAWDNVKMDQESLEAAVKAVEKQAEKRCTAEKVREFDADPAGFWDIFYRNNNNKFFKDRHWLKIEFPELFQALPQDSKTLFSLIEIGCGAGNTVFPFLAETKANVFVNACDYSKEAVQVVKVILTSHLRILPSTTRNDAVLLFTI